MNLIQLIDEYAQENHDLGYAGCQEDEANDSGSETLQKDSQKEVVRQRNRVKVARAKIIKLLGLKEA